MRVCARPCRQPLKVNEIHFVVVFAVTPAPTPSYADGTCPDNTWMDFGAHCYFFQKDQQLVIGYTEVFTPGTRFHKRMFQKALFLFLVLNDTAFFVAKTRQADFVFLSEFPVSKSEENRTKTQKSA